jgi:hypothetical protein
MVFSGIVPAMCGDLREHEEEEIWGFHIHYTGIKDGSVKQYTQDLKAKGWDANLTEMGGKAAILNAQKSDLGMNFACSGETKNGVLTVFSTQ